MELTFKVISNCGKVRDLSFWATRLETCLEVLNSFVRRGYRLKKATLVDVDQSTWRLPVEAFDGRPLEADLRQLEREVSWNLGLPGREVGWLPPRSVPDLPPPIHSTETCMNLTKMILANCRHSLDKSHRAVKRAVRTRHLVKEKVKQLERRMDRLQESIQELKADFRPEKTD